jgi:putative ABC transport system permease protein
MKLNKNEHKGLLFSLKLAWFFFIRNLKTTIFITLIFALILTLPTLTKSVTDGFGAKVKEEMNLFIGDFIIKSKEENGNLKVLYSKLNQLPFLDFYIPVYSTNVLIKDKNDNKVSANLFIIDKFEKFVEINKLNQHLIDGKIDYGKKEILLGSLLTKKGRLKIFPKPLDVESGDIVKVIFGKTSLNLKVMGIYRKDEMGINMYGLIPAKAFGEENFKPNSIVLYLKEPYKSKRDEIYQELTREFPHYTIHSIKEEMVTIDSFLRTFSLISSITSFFGTIIAIIIIYALISINVRNKRVEIGILRALGIREKFLVLTYLFLTTFYLISALVIGLIILKSYEIYFFYNPIHSPLGLVRPSVNYKNFLFNFFELFVFLIFVAYLPIRGVVKENLVSQIRG